MKVILESESNKYFCPMALSTGNEEKGYLNCAGKGCMWWEEVSSLDGRDGYGYCGVKGPIEGLDE